MVPFDTGTTTEKTPHKALKSDRKTESLEAFKCGVKLLLYVVPV